MPNTEHLLRRITVLTLVVIVSVSCSTTKSRNRVYVSLAADKTIASFEIDDRTGELRPLTSIVLEGEPGGLTTDPNCRFVFACIRSLGRLASFRVNAKTGELKLIGTIAAAADPAFISTDRTGKYLLTAYYVAGKVAVHPIAEDGSLSETNASWIDTADKAHAVLTDADNRFAFVPHTGPNEIHQFLFDESRGTLTRNDPAKIHTGTGTGPRQLAFHPENSFVYFDNEQGSSVSSFKLDQNSGRLTHVETLPTLPASYEGKNSCARLEATPSGRFLYAANRGHDSIAGFAIHPKSGRLTSLGQTATETTPRGFAIDPEGRFLIAAGQDSNQLAVYAIDQDKGALTRLHTYATGTRPWWVMSCRLP